MTNPTGQNVLFVPIEINALCLESDQTVMDAKADFSRLPWSNGQEDFNADTPFLGESVLSPPFQNKNFTMAAGVHLHWVLPRAHRTYPTTTDAKGNKKDPYPAPNRWLITNKTSGHQWVVESDYLDTKITTYNKDAVTIPVFNDTRLNPLNPPPASITTNPQPYRYLGRQVPEANWPLNDSPKYWSDEHPGKELTAFGYGEMAFNTFYPNCRSAFGFYDSNTGSGQDTFEVLGWYSNSENDIVKKAITSIENLITTPTDDPRLLRNMFDDDGNCPTWLSNLITNEKGNAAWNGNTITTTNYEQLRALLVAEDPAKPISFSDLLALGSSTYKHQFIRFGIAKILNWEFTEKTGATKTGYPTQSIYYGSITLTGTNEDALGFSKVAIGNSASEALSAYLSNALPNVEAADAGAVEDQLNAILHGSNFQGNLTDASLNFKEAMHESGFEAKQGGSLWRIRKIQITGTGYSDNQELGQMTLPEPLADLLNDLNLAQSIYDKGLTELEDAQLRLYASWSKYMDVSYPPLGTHQDLPDEDIVKDYTQWLCDKVNDLKALVGSFDFKGKPSVCAATGSYGKALLAAYEAAWNYLNTPLSNKMLSLNGDLAASEGRAWELSQVPAPRYYRPKDPVLVFEANGTAPNVQDADPKAPISVVWDDNLALAATGVPIQPDTITGDLPSAIKDSFTSTVAQSTPQILEWLVDFFPTKNGMNVTTGSGDYSNDFLLSQNFSIGANTFDFSQNESVLDAPNSYKGSTYISTTAQKNLQDKLKGFLMGRYSNLTDADFDSATALEAAWEQLTISDKDYTDPGYTAYESYKQLDSAYIFSQSIGGFNQAVIQFQHNIRVPIADPLGFSDYAPFVKNVATALQGVHPPASNPENIFMPLRSGGLHLDAVTLVDHFGRGSSQDVPSPIIAKSLQMTDNPSWLWLGPRFSQEVRLNFRWLAAVNEMGDTDIEMNSHPATSPICGWILPDYFNNSLVFYNQDGKGLGSIHQEDGKWHSFPGNGANYTGSTVPTDQQASINRHLLKVIDSFLSPDYEIDGAAVTATAFISTIISDIQKAQEKIYPENYAGHDALSILMGKPIAIVRAQLNLEVKGGTRADQGWIPFEQQLQGAQPQTDAYDQVQVPINLGDPHQLNDGLIGYWKETSGSATPNIKMVTHDSATYPINQTISDDPVTLTMLVDPHGIVHATSGVLPVKTIDIPPDQYTKALKNIEVAFFSAPLLTSVNDIQLSVPKESGYVWSWLQQNPDGSTWTHIPDLPMIDINTFGDAWTALLPKLKVYPSESGTPWTELVSCNWVKQIGSSDLYQVINPTDTSRKALSTWASYQTEIETLIFKNLTGVTPFNTNAQFAGQQRLLDGWLLLSQQTTTTPES